MHKKLFLTGLALWAPMATADDNDDPEYDDMGPAAFMWPPDRVWSAAADNTSPCGSVASPSNRTDFPLQNGRLALVAQDESWEIELSIAYSDNPRSNNDFRTLIDADQFHELDVGHTCVTVPDSPDTASAGDLATFQVKYIANFDKPENETFYACADVRFVETAAFNIRVPCFNATGEDDGESGAGGDYNPHDELDLDDDDDDEDKTDDNGSSSDDNGNSNSGDNSGNTEESNNGGSGGGSKGLSGGAIAGIVVGALAGVGLIGAGAFFLYRRRQRQAMVARQQNTSRGVKWEERDAAAQAGSVSSDSVRMNNIPA